MAKKADYLPDLILLIEAGATVRDAAISLGLAPSTARRWLAAGDESLERLRHAYRLLVEARRRRGDGAPVQCSSCGYWVLDSLRVHRCLPIEKQKNWWYRHGPRKGLHDSVGANAGAPADHKANDRCE